MCYLNVLIQQRQILNRRACTRRYDMHTWAHMVCTGKLFQGGWWQIYMPIESFICHKSSGAINPIQPLWFNTIYTTHWRLRHVTNSWLAKWKTWNHKVTKNGLIKYSKSLTILYCRLNNCFKVIKILKVCNLLLALKSCRTSSGTIYCGWTCGFIWTITSYWTVGIYCPSTHWWHRWLP